MEVVQPQILVDRNTTRGVKEVECWRTTKLVRLIGTRRETGEDLPLINRTKSRCISKP